MIPRIPRRSSTRGPAVRAGKMRADPTHLSLAQQKQFAHGGHLRQSQNHGLSSRVKSLVGPEPSGSQYLTPRDFSRGYYDAVREVEGETLTADDVSIFLMRREGISVSDP